MALSSGWSLLGNHHQAASGSLAPTPPSAVRCQLVKPYACFEDGIPLYRTTTVTVAPFASGVFGVISSSCSPEVVNAATAPLTRTSLTSSRKSRSNRDRSCVVFARIVAVPSNSSVAGWYFSRRS